MKSRILRSLTALSIALVILSALLPTLPHDSPSQALAARQADPSVTQVDPTSAANDLDTAIVITGADFEAVPTVTLGDTPLDDVTWISATRLEAIVPWGMAPGVYALAVENPGGGTGSLPNAFTVTQGVGIWNATTLYGGSVRELAINPVTPATAYAIAENVGLFRTSDAAGRWSLVVSAGDVRGLALVPTAPDTLYLAMNTGMSHGLHRSDDGGSTWLALHAPGDRAYPHPTDPDVVYALLGGDDGGLWRSGDRGLSWTPIVTGLTDTDLTTLAFHPTNPLTMVVGSANGNLFISANGGDAWSLVAQPIDSVQTLAFNPRGDHEVWVSNACFSGAPGTLRSTDSAYTAWAPAGDPVGAAPMPTIAFPPAAWDSTTYSHTLFVNGCWGDAYRSDDGGAAWSPYGPQTGEWALALHPTDDNIAYRSSASEGVIATSDGGTTWQLANDGLTAVVPRQLEVVPGRPGTLYAITEREDGIYKGTRGGEVWQFLTLAGDWGINSVLVDPVTTTRVYAAKGDPQDRVLVHISEDDGATWPVTAEIPVTETPGCPNFANTLAAHASQPGVVLLGMEHFCFGMPGVHTGDLYYSIDAGLSWTTATVAAMDTISPVTSIAHDALTPTIAYASTGIWEFGSGLLRSVDGGRIWERMAAGIPELDFVHELAVEPSSPYRLIALTDSAGLWLSADHGLTWAQAGSPLAEGFHIEAIRFSDGDPAWLYAAVSESPWGPGLYRSRDGAASWERAPGALSSAPIYALATERLDDRLFLYAGTTGGVVSGGAQSALTRDVALISAGVYRHTQATWRVYLPLTLR